MTTLTQDALVEKLAAIFGAEKVKTDADSLAVFGKDWTKVMDLERKVKLIIFSIYIISMMVLCLWCRKPMAVCRK